MSKNFVRGIDNIKNINKQEYYTNKANDLLSTKEHNYIRKQKREYHCLTDNVKQTKASNVRYTDTTASPNVNYNLITIDNSEVPKNNTNTISAQSLVSALEAKDEQIKELKDAISNISTSAFDGYLYTHTKESPQDRDDYDGIITAKTIKILPSTPDKNIFIVNFNFKGKLQIDTANNKYSTFVYTEDADPSWLTLLSSEIFYLNLLRGSNAVFVNGLDFNDINWSGKIIFDDDGTYTEQTITTATSFTLKVEVRAK